MKKILISVIICACVEMYISQEVTTQGYNPKQHLMFDLEPFDIEDFKKKPEFDDPAVCHVPNMKCLHKLKTKPVCVVEKTNGLISFDNICEVHLQNCLAHPKGGEHVYGVPNKDDIIYYNGKDKPCYYYVKESDTMLDAVKLYYKTAQIKEDIDNNKI